ncbi:hypothetical protein H8356DRAFT_1361467 [Neocallimastix lanati (nom. inval.)]|nr:hypothetical protein H8356DRAFT_1361467 [Neocallimastix sp. JGI-2020a]
MKTHKFLYTDKLIINIIIKIYDENHDKIMLVTEDFGLPHIVIWVTASALSTPHKQRNSILKESRANYRWRPCHPRGAGHCKSSQTRPTQWDSYRKNREDLILVGVDPEDIYYDKKHQ